MRCWTCVLMASLLPAGVVLAGEPSPAGMPFPFTGKVVPVAALKEKPVGAIGVVLVGSDGTVHPIVENDVSRLLFLDVQLQNRPVRLTARVQTGTAALVLTQVQTVKDGKVFDVDYWCPHCLLSASEPGPCRCCGGDTVLRELPVK